ncbi:MAG: hypothetical protein HZA49_06060 [Planctomycetes bacterium]|nr:hypothetical protein [Planctomycetota bacterium]
MANEKTGQKLNPECKDYRLDIVDLATGENASLDPARVKKVLKHLAGCSACREAFLGYEEIYAAAATEKHTKTPEFRQKMDDLISRIKSGDDASKPKSETVSRIIRDADTVYQILEKDGTQVILPDLASRSKLPADKFHQALGYLVCMERINLNDHGTNTFVEMR